MKCIKYKIYVVGKPKFDTIIVSGVEGIIFKKKTYFTYKTVQDIGRVIKI